MIITCEVCKKKFNRNPSRITGRKFCSRECYFKIAIKHPESIRAKRRYKIGGKCVICGDQIVGKRYKTCSKKCLLKLRHHNSLRSNNSQWSGGFSYEYKKGKTSKKWKMLRKSIYKRDNFTCQECGQVGGKLNAHHIIPWRISKDDNPANLITLCKPCHRKIESEYIEENPQN